MSQFGLLHHIEINVSNLQKSIQFWSWLLERFGYQKWQEWNEGMSWKSGDTYIVFVQTLEKYQNIPYHRCRTGLNHLAFHGGSKENIDQLTEELKNKSIPILYKDEHPYAGGEHHYAVYFEDPDRIKIEVVASESLME